MPAFIIPQRTEDPVITKKSPRQIASEIQTEPVHYLQVNPILYFIFTAYHISIFVQIRSMRLV